MRPTFQMVEMNPVHFPIFMATLQSRRSIALLQEMHADVSGVVGLSSWQLSQMIWWGGGVAVYLTVCKDEIVSK